MKKNNSTTKYYSPLRYPGGKSCIFNFVSKVFYENEMIGTNYAEPYAGGAGLALRLLFEEYVDKIFINDLDTSIYSFWKTILDYPDLFCDWIEDVEVSIENWHFYKEIQKSSKHTNINQIDLAKSTFFLNRTNISGVIKGGAIGGLEQKGKYKIDARFKKDDLISKIQKIASFRKRIIVSNDDGLKFIKRLEKKKEEVFIYLDPPYYQKAADLYMNFYSKQNHSELAKYVNKMKKKWMISYDNHDFILNLYENKRKIIYQLSQCASNRVGDEILIFPDDINIGASINSLKCPTLLNHSNSICA